MSKYKGENIITLWNELKLNSSPLVTFSIDEPRIKELINETQSKVGHSVRTFDTYQEENFLI